MPKYTYRDLVTDDVFEVEQSIRDSPLIVHPTTGNPVKRIPHAVPVVLKGGGWAGKRQRGGPPA